MAEKFRWLAIILLLIDVMIFIIQNIISGFTDAFILLSSDVAARPWTIVTSMFLHGSVSHLFYNMFSLGLFGSMLEKLIGSKKFIAAYFSSGIVAGIAAAFFYDASLGASGAIFGLLGYLAVIRPKMMIWTYGAPMPMFVAVFFWVLINFSGFFFPTNIAVAAHLGGLFFGALLGFFNRKKLQENVKEKPLKEEDIDDWERRYMN